ncbi:MAG: fimbrial protein [Muribaculaceae bacterium]
MKRIKNIGLWVVALLVLASCSNDAVDEKLLPKDAVQIKLSLGGQSNVQNRAPQTGTPDENYIGNIQVFIFTVTADNTGLLEKVISFDADKSTTDDMLNTWDKATNTITIRGIEKGEKVAYAVANGTKANGFDQELFKVGVTTQQTLIDHSTQRQGNIVAPSMGSNGLLMCGNVRFKAPDNNSISIPMVRQVAKVNLHVALDKSFSDSYPGIKFGEASISPATFTTYNVPTHSYLLEDLVPHTPTLPALSTLLDYQQMNFRHVGLESAREWKAEIYVYENPQTGNTIADMKQATQFLISIPYSVGGVRYENKYIININDKSDTNSPYKTKRNNIYDVNVTVLGFGSANPDTGRTTVTTEVLPWNAVDLEENVGNFIKLPADTRMVRMLERDEEYYLSYEGDNIVEPIIESRIKPYVMASIDRKTHTITFKRPENSKREPVGILANGYIIFKWENSGVTSEQKIEVMVTTLDSRVVYLGGKLERKDNILTWSDERTKWYYEGNMLNKNLATVTRVQSESGSYYKWGSLYVYDATGAGDALWNGTAWDKAARIPQASVTKNVGYDFVGLSGGTGGTDNPGDPCQTYVEHGPVRSLRTPTRAQWESLLATRTHYNKLQTLDGQKGFYFGEDRNGTKAENLYSGNSEWGYNYHTLLFLPAAGRRNSTGALDGNGSVCYYLTSTLSPDAQTPALPEEKIPYALSISEGLKTNTLGKLYRADAMQVRCVKDWYF